MRVRLCPFCGQKVVCREYWEGNDLVWVEYNEHGCMEKSMNMEHRKLLEEVDVELTRAVRLHGPMASPHEAWAVIYEEIDELWEEVRKKPSKRSKERMREELVQIAAMAVRAIKDICE